MTNNKEGYQPTEEIGVVLGDLKATMDAHGFESLVNEFTSAMKEHREKMDISQEEANALDAQLEELKRRIEQDAKRLGEDYLVLQNFKSVLNERKSDNSVE